MSFSVVVDTSQMSADFRAFAAKLKDGKKPLGIWAKDIARETVKTMDACGVASRGGSDARLASAGLKPWAPAAIQYVRKTDGVTVPAWGGVPKARAISANAPGARKFKKQKVFRGRELVLGRKRASGRSRMMPTSKLLRDTGQMVNSALSRPAVLTHNEVVLRSNPEYADWATEKSGGRIWLFAAPQDEQQLTRRFEEYVRELIAAGRLG